MDRIRFSMASLMGLVFVVAIALAALRSATVIWAVVITTFVWGTLSFAVLRIIYGRGNVRRFWTGFAVFGLSFASYTFAVGSSSSAAKLLEVLYSKIAHAAPPEIRSNTVAIWVRSGKPIWIDGEEAADDNQIVELLHKAHAKKLLAPALYYVSSEADLDEINAKAEDLNRIVKAQGIRFASPGEIPQTYGPEPNPVYFMRVGFAMMTLLAAFLGGFLALLLLRTKEKSTNEAKSPEGA